ncbi:MAG: type IV pilus modification PilV family protein [Candidatus Saccharimonadales bacterium]
MIQKQRGFTIVESLAGIAVIAVIVLGVATMFWAGQANLQRSAAYDAAVREANRKIESMRNNTYSGLVAGTTIDFSGELPNSLPNDSVGKVVISEPEVGLKRVDVMIEYRIVGQQEKVQLSSMIGILGIAR